MKLDRKLIAIALAFLVVLAAAIIPVVLTTRLIPRSLNKALNTIEDLKANVIALGRAADGIGRKLEAWDEVTTRKMGLINISPQTVLEVKGYEAGMLVAFKEKLVFSDKSGIYVSTDGYTWDLAVKEILSMWAYQVFPQDGSGDLYIGGSMLTPGLSYDHPIIYKYDRQKFQIVYDDASNGYFASLAVFQGKLYAGGYNKIVVSSDGATWKDSFNFNTGRNIFGLADLNGKLYAFEGEPLRDESRIYVFDGNRWELHSTYPIKGFRTCIGNDRATFGGVYYTGDYNNRLYTFDGQKLRMVFERKREDEAITTRSHYRPKLVQGSLFLSGGSGTTTQGYGELWKSDRHSWRKLFEAPYAIVDVEFFRDSLYVAGFTTSDQTYLPRGEPMPDYSLNQTVVVKLPGSILTNNLSATYSLEAVSLPLLPPLAASKLEDSMIIGLEGASKVALTAEAAFGQKSSQGLRVHVRSSADINDASFDTMDVASFDLPPVPGGVGRRTMSLEPSTRYTKVLLENLDRDEPAREVKVTATVLR